ncbi:hypothetical protein DL764_004023 [Monosporascus ibericus]|uniref:LEA domain-containing protein n=1 Tax=Monosporascus ibericus TaxID=155417 RepID=A0A4Q4THU5_9PEZI|nr:hypothetical protein DL764_004023 [Monosporascus ibericus]
MSYTSEIAARRMALLCRAPLVQTRRQFSTTIAAQKSTTETVKESLKQVDRKVSDKLVDGINVGSAAAQKVAGVAEAGGSKARASAEELRGEAKGKASELQGELQGKASELKGEAKGAAKEAEGKVKGSL